MTGTGCKEETELASLTIRQNAEKEDDTIEATERSDPPNYAPCESTKHYENLALRRKECIKQANGNIVADMVRERRNVVPHDSESDVIDGASSATIEVDEIAKPVGRRREYIVSMPVQPEGVPSASNTRYSPDETDNYVEKEPSYSFSNPAETEEIVEASASLDGATTMACCLRRSTWIEKRFEELIHAVNYHETEKVKQILHDEEHSTLARLLTMRDKAGLPCTMKAIARQSVSCLRQLLDLIEKIDFDLYGIDKMDAFLSENNKNLFHFAAQIVHDRELVDALDNIELVEELADREDDCKVTPLIVACRYQNHLMARRLVNYNAKIDHVDNNGHSPIYWAVLSGCADTLKMFLVHGARNAENQLEFFRRHQLYNNDGTILQAIVESKCPGILQVCLENDNGKDDIVQCLREELRHKRTFIHAICETPLVDLVELAIEETERILTRRDDDNDGVTPLMKATEARQLGVVRVILSTNNGSRTLSQSKQSTKETALMIACKKGYHEIVQFILEIADKDLYLKQLDVNNRNAFHHAAEHHEILSTMIEICNRREIYKNYKEYLQSKDNYGYVALHLAAVSGSCESVKLLLEHNVPYNTPSSGLGRTALHYATCSNLDTVKTLLEFVQRRGSAEEMEKFIDAEDSRLQTSLHIAASLGKWQTVTLLLDFGATIKCDKENETPLHLAAYNGSVKTIELLLRKNPEIVNSENRVGETAAMFAAVNGQTKALQMLLDKDAALWAHSHCESVEKRNTCLDWAVMNKRPNAARAILEHEHWKKAMERSSFGSDGILARMVRDMPSVAIEVLDKCEEKSDYETTYDFFALQTKTVLEGQPCGNTTEVVTAMEALETMAQYSRNECLSHATVQRFLDQKWSLRARKWYMSCLFLYTIFLISFTVYITLITEGWSDGPCMITSLICYVVSVLSVIKESFQLFHKKLGYFCCVSTYLEVIMYICVFIFMPNEHKSNSQLQAGAIAIFLGWINFVWFLKRFPTYGIYIIMAKKIFVTFLKVFVPISFFIMAFSMTFFVLLHEKDGENAFENIVRSFVTSFAMMAGEVDYRGTFLAPSVQSGANFVLILLFLVLFLVLMSILLMNLLTGLAVGDIGVIMKRSLAEKRIQQAMLIVEMDKYLSKYPGLGATFVKPLIVAHSHDVNCKQRLMTKLFRLDFEEDKKEKEGCQCTRMAEELKIMKDTLDEIKSSLQMQDSRKIASVWKKNALQARRSTIT